MADSIETGTPDNRLSAADRYRRDPQFATLVNVMRGQIEAGNFTPTELREAVIYAATLHEMYRERAVMQDEMYRA